MGCYDIVMRKCIITLQWHEPLYTVYKLHQITCRMELSLFVHFHMSLLMSLLPDLLLSMQLGRDWHANSTCVVSYLNEKTRDESHSDAIFVCFITNLWPIIYSWPREPANDYSQPYHERQWIRFYETFQSLATGNEAEILQVQSLNA